MPKHTVDQGESLNSIAWDQRSSYKTLWDHAENAELKAARGDPNTLLPGDEVFYPEKEEKEEGRGDSAQHPFRLPGVPFRLKLRILNANRKPLKGVDWELKLDGESQGVRQTDDEGWIEQKIGPEVSSATLLVNGTEVPLKLRHLNPANTVTGAQQRLANLAYDVGPIDGIAGPMTKAALRRFQIEFGGEGVTPDGLLSGETIKALRQVHEDAELEGKPNQAENEESAAPPQAGAVQGSDDEDEADDDEGLGEDEGEDDAPEPDYSGDMAIAHDASREMPGECLQTLLSAMGYDPGPIDGIVGPLTRAAVEEFQSDHQVVHKLAVDGIAGPLTRTALRQEHADV